MSANGLKSPEIPRQAEWSDGCDASFITEKLVTENLYNNRVRIQLLAGKVLAVSLGFTYQTVTFRAQQRLHGDFASWNPFGGIMDIVPPAPLAISHISARWSPSDGLPGGGGLQEYFKANCGTATASGLERWALS